MKGRIIVILVMTTLVLLGASGFVYITQDHTAPVIEVPAEPLLYTEGENESVLLKGVTASDAEDGDLTDEVRIYDVAVLDNGKQAIVTYAVYDSHNNLGKESRLIDYKALVRPTTEEPTPEEEAAKDPETKKAEKIEKAKEKSKVSNSVTTTSNVVKLDKNDTSAQKQLELEEEERERKRQQAGSAQSTYIGGEADNPDPEPTPAQPAASEPAETPQGSGQVASEPSGGEQQGGGEGEALSGNPPAGEVGGGEQQGGAGTGEPGGGAIGGGEQQSGGEGEAPAAPDEGGE